jgi:protoheme IX farnesyltransferase
VGMLPFIFGFITLIFYNVIYTPMKRVSSFAVIPGSIVGALPPLIGWTAFNSNFLDPLIVSFCFFIFVWQIPHFWILLLIYKDDYKLAEYPMITDTMEVKRLRNIIFIWIISLCLTSLFFPYFIEDNYYFNKIIILIANLALSVKLINQTKKLLSDQEVIPKYLFKSINLYVMWILIIVVLDKIISNLIR